MNTDPTSVGATEDELKREYRSFEFEIQTADASRISIYGWLRQAAHDSNLAWMVAISMFDGPFFLMRILIHRDNGHLIVEQLKQPDTAESFASFSAENDRI
jgi:hypothetical protein